LQGPPRSPICGIDLELCIEKQEKKMKIIFARPNEIFKKKKKKFTITCGISLKIGKYSSKTPPKTPKNNGGVGFEDLLYLGYILSYKKLKI